jgi:hypothetical protein
VSGSAKNGEDYKKLSSEVTIPKGATSAEIVVEAIDDQLAEASISQALRVLGSVTNVINLRDQNKALAEFTQCCYAPPCTLWQSK